LCVQCTEEIIWTKNRLCEKYEVELNGGNESIIENKRRKKKQ